MAARGSIVPAPNKMGTRKDGTGSVAGTKNTLAVSEAKWAKFIGLVSEGLNVPDALKRLEMPRAALEGLIRTNPSLKEQYEEAKLAGMRAGWDMDVVEDIIIAIAGNTAMDSGPQGPRSVKAIVEDYGCSYQSFLKLILRDPVVNELYDEARKIQMEGMVDDILAISDNSDRDTYETEAGHLKVNHEVVQRDRLRVDTRKWIMSKLHWKRFGDKVQQEVDMNVTVNHAEELEDARRRKEALAKARKQVSEDA